MNNTFSIAIAIDFGTTFSGYAYCLSAHTSAGDIYKNTEWTKQVGQKNSYIKTPTHLLYKDEKLEAWGYHAKRRLGELSETEDAADYCFFENFKPKLFERDCVDERGEPYIEQNGQRFFIVDLVADYLRELRLTALNDVKSHIGAEINESRIRWCLTVPAIWDDAAKQLMEQAAQKAGIAGKEEWNAEHFMFALEPEAAAIYCLYVADKELGIVENESTMMIIDCGGGTVDLTVHEIIRDGVDKGLREVVPGSGAAEGHGGKDVDKNFIAYLKTVFGTEAIDQFEAEYPDSYLDMLDDWEDFKYGFDPDGYIRGNFRIPAELRDLLKENYPDALAALSRKQKKNTYNLWLTRKTMEKEIFGPVVDNIVDCVEKVFSRIGGECDYIYMVGGFSTARFLQQAIRKKFGSRVRKKILIPGEPGKSVMVGAASFARSPEIILPRKSRLTYGIGSAIRGVPVFLLLGEFLPDQLPDGMRSEIQHLKKEVDNDMEIQKVMELARRKAEEVGRARFIEHLAKRIDFDEGNGEISLNRYFTPFIRYGDTVVKDHQVPDVFIDNDASSREAAIEIFATEQAEVLFVDEHDVEKIGEINLKLPPIDENKSRTIEVSMFFGDTKLKVKAKSLESDEEVEADLDFLTMHRQR
jgi:Hsp70 protein